MLRSVENEEDAYAELMKERQAKMAAAEAEANRIKAELEEKRKAKEAAKKKAEDEAWAIAKQQVQARAAAKEAAEKSKTSEHTATEAVLYMIDQMAQQARDAEEQAKRSDRLAKVLGEDSAAKMKKRARRNSKELQDKMESLLDGHLAEAFQQFDLDGSGTLDEGELAEAYAAAGMPIAPAALKKAMKMMDTNGDGVIDLEEFKAIAVKAKVMAE